jgi:hypothetical protein
MTGKTIIYLVILGLIVLAISAAATAQMNARMDDIGKELTTMGGDFSSQLNYLKRTSLERERDTLGERMAWSITGIVLGALIIAAGPLHETTRRWRGGQLSIPMKQATAAVVFGIMISIVCLMAAASLNARVASINRDIAEIEAKMGTTPSSDYESDEITILTLLVEKNDISGRIPWLWAGAAVGFLATLAGALLAYMHRAEFIDAQK